MSLAKWMDGAEIDTRACSLTVLFRSLKIRVTREHLFVIQMRTRAYCQSPSFTEVICARLTDEPRQERDPPCSASSAHIPPKQMTCVLESACSSTLPPGLSALSTAWDLSFRESCWNPIRRQNERISYAELLIGIQKSSKCALLLTEQISQISARQKQLGSTAWSQRSAVKKNILGLL